MAEFTQIIFIIMCCIIATPVLLKNGDTITRIIALILIGMESFLAFILYQFYSEFWGGYTFV